MRRGWAGAWIVCVGCWTRNPAFFEASATGDATDTGATAAPTTTGTTHAPSTTDIDSSTTAPGTTGTADCGDGFKDPDEFCDQGPTPPLEPDACRPDCKGTIPTKRIFVTPEPVGGSFGMGIGVAGADALCNEAAVNLPGPSPYRAMVSDGVRRASMQPYDGVCSDDWPIQSFTAYVNLQGQLVWVTGELRLLGVEPGAPNAPAPLLAAIDLQSDRVWTGMKNTWQTASTCEQWKGGVQLYGTHGDPSAVENFLDAGDELCAADYGLVCVEQ